MLRFFTVWCLVLFLLSENFDLPSYTRVGIYISVITCGIYGHFLIVPHYQAVAEQFNVVPVLVLACDFLFHLCTASYATYKLLKLSNLSVHEYIKSVLFIGIYGFTYLIFYNPEHVYAFSKQPKLRLIVTSATICICFHLIHALM